VRVVPLPDARSLIVELGVRLDHNHVFEVVAQRTGSKQACPANELESASLLRQYMGRRSIVPATGNDSSATQLSVLARGPERRQLVQDRHFLRRNAVQQRTQSAPDEREGGEYDVPHWGSGWVGFQPETLRVM
jgi:hypothetical protein